MASIGRPADRAFAGTILATRRAILDGGRVGLTAVPGLIATIGRAVDAMA